MPILRYLFPRSSTHQMVNMFYSSKPSTSTDSNTGPIVEPAEDRPEITPEPTKDEIKLDKKMLIKLERLSGLRFKNVDEIENLQADIRLANKLFEVDTEGVEPMYSVVEERINCPLREDIAKVTDPNKILMNAPELYEDAFVTRKPNIPMTENPLFDEFFEQLNKKKGD